MALPRITFDIDDQSGRAIHALDIEPSRFRGSQSVFGATFHLPVSLFTFPERSYRPSLFAGTLCWADEPDGLAIPLQPLLFNRSELAIPVSDDQLARLDVRRAGSEPRFTLYLWGTAQEIATGTVRNVRGGSFPTNVQVPHNQWLVVLKACGFGERQLIELPAPPTDLEGDWRSAAERLAAAANRLAEGEPGVALGEVRIALERIADAVGARLGIARANASGKKMPLATYIDAIASDLKKRHVDNIDDPFAVLSALFKATFGFAQNLATQVST